LHNKQTLQSGLYAIQCHINLSAIQTVNNNNNIFIEQTDSYK
jgi:hypothetical protein